MPGIVERPELMELIRKSRERYEAMTPEQKAEHDKAQRESFVRAETDWPKPNFRWVNGVKVYDSYEDYLDD